MKKLEGRLLINCIYIAIIIAILLSNFFTNSLSILLRLKPDYKFNFQTEVHFINVGQGDAIAIKFSNREVMLIDTGIAEYRSDLLNYLDNVVLEGDKTIDYLVLTHIDIDHSGNMQYILDNYNVEVLYRPLILSKCEDENSINSSEVYDNIISTAISKNVELRFNEEGNHLSIDGSILTWLYPINLGFDDEIESNEYSPVIRLDYNGHSALFTGDITSKIEKNLINYYSEEMLDIDILKLAHHGSAYSNSYEFIEATSPQYACVCVGKNTYGHPSSDVLERVLKYDNEKSSSLYDNLYSTKEHGNVIFTLKNEISINSIDNISNYSFVSYYVYSSLAIFVVLIMLITPYLKFYIKKRRFFIQNKKFEENKHKSIENHTK